MSARTRIAALFPLAAVVVFVALHFLQPGLDAQRYPVSDYASGPYGDLATVAFVLLGFGAWAVASIVRATTATRFGAWLLRLFSLGILAVAAFPPPAPGDHSAAGQANGAAHGALAFIAFLSLMAAMLIVARSFARARPWRRFAWPTRALGAVALLLVYGERTVPAGSRGLWERIYLAIVLGWLAWVGLHAAVSARRANRRRPPAMLPLAG